MTGNSDTADYKDTILTNAPPITNCESTTVTTPKLVTDTSTNPDTATNVPAGGASIGTGVLGVADSAVVSLTGGTATPTGSVAFFLCKLDGTALCSTGGTPVGSTGPDRRRLPRDGAVARPRTSRPAGRYCWRARLDW